MESHKGLLIIPGLGDREHLYATVLPLWRHYGYDAHIYNFGWGTPDNEFKDALNKLEERIETYPGKLAIIGASAGGTAALHAGLRHPDKVENIAIISTPLVGSGRAKNHLLRQSIDELGTLLKECDPKVLTDKTLSVYGLYDHRVDIPRSQYDGMPQHQIPVIGHGLIIASALTWLSQPIRDSF